MPDRVWTTASFFSLMMEESLPRMTCDVTSRNGWKDGPKRQRVTCAGDLGERNRNLESLHRKVLLVDGT